MQRASILPVDVQNLRELNNFPRTNRGRVSARGLNGRREETIRHLPHRKREALPISFPRRRKRLLHRAAKVERRSITRPPVAAATFHKRSYERAWLLRQRAARLVLAFAICKSRRARARARIYTRGALRYRDPRVSLSFFRRFASGRPPELDP